MVACHGTGIGLVTRFPATAPATSHFLVGRALRHALPLNITVARHSIGIGFVTRFPATAPATSHFLGGRGLGPPLLSPPHPRNPPPPPPHGCAPRPWHRLGYPIPRHGTRYLTLPQRSRAWSPATTTSSTSSTSSISTSRLRVTASASAWLPDSPPRHPLPHISSAVAGLVPHYYHLLHLLHLLHLHLMVARHGTGIGLVTRFPATTPTPSHFLGGRALLRALPLNITVARHGIGIGFVTQFPAMAPATSHFFGGHALRRALPLNIPVARHGIGIGFVTRFPATAPATSHFLGGRGLGPALLPPPPPPAPPPPPPHGCALRHRHRLGYPIPHHGTRYLTFPQQSRAWSPATTTSSTSSTSSTATSRLHTTAPASAWLPDSLPRHPLPHTSLAVARSGVRALRRSLPPHLFRGGALRRLLPHTFSAGSRFGVCCFSTSPTAAASAPFKHNDTTTDFNECTRFSLLMSCALCLSISLVRLLLLADGKDGSTMGVVWRGGAHKT